jgi:G:T-mismatch repair DNA endonuclease (very short patch repair protein)
LQNLPQPFLEDPIYFLKKDLQQLSKKISSLLLLLCLFLPLRTQAQTANVPTLSLTTFSQKLQLGAVINLTLTVKRNGYTGPISQVNSDGYYAPLNTGATCCFSFTTNPTSEPDTYTVTVTPNPGRATSPGTLKITSSVLASGIVNGQQRIFSNTVEIDLKKISFSRSDGNTTTDITDKKQTVTVGEQVAISARIDNLPSGTQQPKGIWTVPGTDPTNPANVSNLLAIANWQGNVNQGVLTPLTTEKLNSTDLTFYWVAPDTSPSAQANQDVTYKVNVDGIDYTGTVKFTIKRPAVNVSAVNGSIFLGNRYQPGDSGCTTTLLYYALQFGRICTNSEGSQQPGIDFSASGNTTQFPGNYQWVQLISSQLTYVQQVKGGKAILRQQADNLLDTDKTFIYPYNKKPPSNSVYSTNDSPFSELGKSDKSLNRNDNFDMWFMYKSSSNPSNIWVPLASVNWGWIASVASDQSNPGGFSFVSSPTTITPTVTNTIKYPVWAGNYIRDQERPNPDPNLFSGSVVPGATVSVTYTGLSQTSSVFFNDSIPANFTIVSDTKILITVPANLPPGPATLTIKIGTTTLTLQVRLGRPDFVALNGQSTGSGKLEIHGLSSDSNYQSSVLDAASSYGLDPNNTLQLIDMDIDSQPDLVTLNGTATASGKTEIRVLSASSKYQTQILNVVTANGLDSRNRFQLIDMDLDGKPDLVVINQGTSGTGATTISVFSAASNYQTQISSTVTAFPYDPNNTLQLIDIDGDARPDLVALNSTSTSSGKTEIRVLSASSNYQTQIRNVATGNGLDSRNRLQMADMDADGTPDLVIINQGSSGTEPTTLYVFSAASNYQTQSLSTVTAFPYNPGNIFKLVNLNLDANTTSQYRAPRIDSFTPTSASVDSSITITGIGLSTTTAVNFFGTPATSYFVTSDTLVTATVPTTTKPSGLLGITTTSGIASSSTNFTIPAPVISGFNSTTVPISGTLIINGTNLTGATVVKINGVSVPFTPGSSITVLIPSGITSGLVSVTTPGGTATSPIALTVPAAPLDVSVVMEDDALPVLKNFAQYYSGYPTPVSSPTGSPRNPVNRYNITPASRKTTVDCFTGVRVCPTP